MKIEVGKTYLTRDNRKVRIICTDRKRAKKLTVIGLLEKENDERILNYFSNGKFDLYNEHCGLDLISEYSFWNDVPVDAKVLVRDYEDSRWQHKHFAKYKYGKVYGYSLGATSWSNGSRGTHAWRYAKLYEEEAK